MFGLEGEATESSARIKVGGIEAASAGRDLYAGGRTGFVAGKALIYAKAGYTNARVETLVGSENGDGFRVGGGSEYRLGHNLALKAEYRYSNYEGDVERHQVVAGLGFVF